MYLKCDDGNEHDKYVVAVIIKEQTVGHISKNLSKIFKFFLTLPSCVIKCKFVAKHINQGAGYEIALHVQS